MKRVFLLGTILGLFFFGLISASSVDAKLKTLKTEQPFEGYVLVEGLENPWNICYGPDNMLWVTERTGKRIVRINPETGAKKVAITIDEVLAEGGHQGILGMALEPNFMKANSKNYVYVFYTYKNTDNISSKSVKKLVRFEYDIKSETLKNPTTIIADIPAGTDHNGGRVVFGPDGMIYISLGELGHNQFAYFREAIEAQRLPTATEMANKDYSAYVGKVLRINPNGSIPADNPTLDGVKSHIFTYGHRNPQGLDFVGDKLFSSEHGPSTDDELNLLVSGGNYGWPHVAGYIDDQSYVYANWSKAPRNVTLNWDANIIDPSVPSQKESEWDAPLNFKEPLKTFYTVSNAYNFQDGSTFGDLGYAQWPTIGPSSLRYYPSNGTIPGWDNSVLITTLKNGTLYRVKLTSDQENVQGDVATFFHTPNRYRDICVSPDNKTFYILTDSAGTAKGYDLKPTATVQNPGAILIFKYAPKK